MELLLVKNKLIQALGALALISSFNTSAQMYISSPLNDIPDDNLSGITDTISISASGLVNDLNVPIHIAHSHIGDLIVTLESPNGTIVSLIDQPGFTGTGTGCNTNTIDVTLVDTSSFTIESACPAIIDGYYTPQSPLSTFNGESITGDWILTVSDNGFLQLGSLVNWRLVFNYDNSVPPVVYVDQNATGNNDGSSWANAYTELTDATESAWGNQIWVAEGTYFADDSDRERSFSLLDGVQLYGGFNATESMLSERDWSTNSTILSGDLLGNDNGIVAFDEPSRDDNTHVLLRIISEGTVIDGVTISDAQANSGSNYYNRGAGIYKDNLIDSIVVKNCVIKNNAARLSAGIHAEYYTSTNPNLIQSAIIDKCIFEKNVSGYASSFGIASFAGTVNAFVTNCIITENRSESNSTSACFGGSAGFFDSRNSSILNAFLLGCTVVNNEENEDAGVPVASSVAIRRFTSTSTLNFVAANSIFYENVINSLNSPTATFGALNSSNCPTSTLLQNNVRPDYTVIGCQSTTTSTGEIDTLGVLLDTDFSQMNGSVTINAGDTTGISGFITNNDIANNDRVLENIIDIGCHEYCSTLLDVTTSTYFQDNQLYLQVDQSSATASYQWLDCNNNNASISGLNGSSFAVSQNGSFACVVSDGCATDTSDCFVIDNLSIDELTSPKQLIFPIPTTGTLNITNGKGHARIITLSGKVILETEIMNEQLNVSMLPIGVYLLEIQLEESSLIRRFVKE